MKWTNLELGTVWHNDDHEDIYKLVLEISNDWKVTSEKMWKLVYYDYPTLLKSYKLYAGIIMHDGNRTKGVTNHMEKIYREEGNYKRLNPWTNLQHLLEYIRQAEVLIDLFELKIKEDK